MGRINFAISDFEKSETNHHNHWCSWLWCFVSLFSKAEIAKLSRPIVYWAHSSRLEAGVWRSLSCTNDTTVLYAGASAKYGRGYRWDFGPKIHPGLVRRDRWWTRHWFGERVWLWVELEKISSQNFWKSSKLYLISICNNLKAFLPRFACNMGKMKLYIWNSTMLSKSKSVEISTMTEISGQKIFRVIGGPVKVFETIFGIFISLKHFLKSVALLGN